MIHVKSPWLPRANRTPVALGLAHLLVFLIRNAVKVLNVFSAAGFITSRPLGGGHTRPTSAHAILVLRVVWFLHSATHVLDVPVNAHVSAPTLQLSSNGAGVLFVWCGSFRQRHGLPRDRGKPEEYLKSRTHPLEIPFSTLDDLTTVVLGGDDPLDDPLFLQVLQDAGDGGHR